MKHFALKSIFLSLVLSLTALPSVAQSIQKLTIKVPKATRFLQIKNEGVNLRRLPNTTSGKLMIWNSDDGSYDTYAKLFYSDTEAARFRPNRNTGAYIEAYHPQKGEVMMLNPQKSEAQNGWYQVLATAPEYAGNPGQGNTKLGWIRGDFCKVIDKVEPSDDQLGDLEVLINGVMPTDQVYFMGNDGRSYKINFDSNVASSIAYDTYYYPLHRQQ